MYKSNIFHQKEEIYNFPTNKAYNYFSPPYNSKYKTKAYYNANINNNILLLQFIKIICHYSNIQFFLKII